MKKSIIIITIAIVAGIVLGASVLAFENSNSPQTTTTATPTPTVTSTSQPTLTSTSPTASPTSTATSTVTHYTYSIVNTYPHNTNAFTEGLTYSDGYLYEGTGPLINNSGDTVGPSSLRKVDLTTGNIVQQITLPSQYFGEGITIVNNRIIQLTWQSNIGFVYDKDTFIQIANFTYPTQGWGLTYNGSQLIMSDGTDNLYFLNPTSFERTGQIQVHDGTSPVVNINELEFINGDVYANIWMTSQIAIINPQTGQVKAWIDLSGLPAPAYTGDNVLNGIAYDQQNNRLFVTGKEWPNLYQIQLVPKA